MKFHPAACLAVLTLAATASADFQWVTISSGTYGGSGFDLNLNTAISKCAADTQHQFIQLAQQCCGSTDNTTSAEFGGRCAGGYNGPLTHRSFFGGVAAYFC